MKRRHGPRLYREFLIAAERGNPQTLQIFIDGGIDVNYQDPKTGQTALHVFAPRGRGRRSASFLRAVNVIF